MTPKSFRIFHLLPLFCLPWFALPVLAQTDDDGPEETVKGTAADEALWKKLDRTQDGWLDGNELDGNWIRFDLDDDDEVTKEEWIMGRASERNEKKSAVRRVIPKAIPKSATPKPLKATPRRAALPTKARTTKTPATKPRKVVKLAPVVRRAGYIVGRAVKTNGSPVPSFTVDYSGFEDGKLASMFNGQIYETLVKSGKGAGGRYAVKVPPGAYRATAYTTYRYRGRVYHFDMELGAPKPRYDFESSQLEKLRGGLVRNFVLKMQEKKAGASEESESLYGMAYYGGTVELDCRQYEGVIGGGNQLSTPLRNAYPAESRILLTLTPIGARVDGSPGQIVKANLRLGDDGKWIFVVRGVFPGVYSASANLQLPNGTVKPLRLATKTADTVRTATGYDQLVFNRNPSATVDFLPKEIGVAPRMGVAPVRLYLGD